MEPRLDMIARQLRRRIEADEQDRPRCLQCETTLNWTYGEYCCPECGTWYERVADGCVGKVLR